MYIFASNLTLKEKSIELPSMHHENQSRRRQIRPIDTHIVSESLHGISDEKRLPAQGIFGAITPVIEAGNAIVIEGPPIYLGQRCVSLPADCRWDSHVFQEGCTLTDALTHNIVTTYPNTPVYHHALIDDVNYVPDGGFTMSDLRALARFRRSSGGLMARHSVRCWEREFKHNPNDTCSMMDARFQLSKFERHGLTVLNVVVHPSSFRQQQLGMLERILGNMKQGTIYRHLTKVDRRSLIEDAFRHVWIGPTGQPEDITKPVFDGSKFQHISIH